MAYPKQIFKEKECVVCKNKYSPKTGNSHICSKECYQ